MGLLKCMVIRFAQTRQLVQMMVSKLLPIALLWMQNILLVNHVQCVVNACKTYLVQNQWTHTATSQRYAHFITVYIQCPN